jgi:hypothetical protein
MSEINKTSPPPDHEPKSTSWTCVNIFFDIDGPSESLDEPTPESVMKVLRREREKYLQWEAELKQQEQQQKNNGEQR